MCTTHEVPRRENEDGANIIMQEKNHRNATTFSWTTCNTVDSKRRLTNLKVTVSQSVSQSVSASSL